MAEPGRIAQDAAEDVSEDDEPSDSASGNDKSEDEGDQIAVRKREIAKRATRDDVHVAAKRARTANTPLQRDSARNQDYRGLYEDMLEKNETFKKQMDEVIATQQQRIDELDEALRVTHSSAGSRENPLDVTGDGMASGRYVTIEQHRTTCREASRKIDQLSAELDEGRATIKSYKKKECNFQHYVNATSKSKPVVDWDKWHEENEVFQFK
nr:uncharacterized protein CI109_002136 [Kwoniella shandongensis]KAA5529246.1 hypothetical protein CI109_002136 [Kwoniella shandongensis]